MGLGSCQVKTTRDGKAPVELKLFIASAPPPNKKPGSMTALGSIPQRSLGQGRCMHVYIYICVYIYRICIYFYLLIYIHRYVYREMHLQTYIDKNNTYYVTMYVNVHMYTYVYLFLYPTGAWARVSLRLQNTDHEGLLQLIGLYDQGASPGA